MKIENYLRESPVFTINVIHEQIVTNVNQRLRNENVNLLQGLILTALVFEEGASVTPSDLARVFQTSRGNISHAISDLEYKGLVLRSLSPKDARKFFILVKPEGKKIAYRLIKFYDRLQEAFEAELGSAQCRNTVESLRTLAQAYRRKV